METIKKVVQRKMKLLSSGVGSGTLIPDPTAFYYFNLNINAEVKDWGFFDAYVVEEEENQYDTDFDYVVELPDDVVIVEPPDRELIPAPTPISVTTGNWTALYSNLDAVTPTLDGSVPYDSLSTESVL